jgi:hypothetical protein
LSLPRRKALRRVARREYAGSGARNGMRSDRVGPLFASGVVDS